MTPKDAETVAEEELTDLQKFHYDQLREIRRAFGASEARSVMELGESQTHVLLNLFVDLGLVMKMGQSYWLIQ